MMKKYVKFTYWEYTEEYYIDDKFSDGRLDGNFPVFMTIIFKTLNQKNYIQLVSWKRFLHVQSFN